MAADEPRPDPFPPHVLREYALLADGERGAIIGPRGEIVWLCVPRWDSDAVFAALIGGRGAYQICPAERFVWGGYYEAGSLIWRSRWVTDDGIVECREALAFPGDADRAVLLRRLHAVDTDVRVRVHLEPRAGYGRSAVEDLRHEHGVWTARCGSVAVRWQGGADAHPAGDGQALVSELTLRRGERRDFVLELGSGRLPEQLPDADEAWQRSERAWRDTVPRLDHVLAPNETRHSYAVLRGLTSASGGMVAAATTSLPERAEAGRNYDYRYVWIRDQCFAGQAVAACGGGGLQDDAVRFVTARLLADADRMTPAYTTTGAPVPEQRELGLPGYPGGGSRVGNWVRKQFQLDAFGEALLLLARAVTQDRIDSDGRRAARVAADVIARRWRDQDAGIWELEARQWTHSRLICAAGLRAFASAGTDEARAGDWLVLADRITADTSAGSLHRDGHWQRSPEDTAVDGALLFPPLRGSPDPGDPRTVATLRVFERELTEGGFAYRFRHDRRDLGAAEGAFVLCGFAMALATHQQGRSADAMGWFERSRAACGPPVLYTEEFDVGEHQLRGNLPQAFVHALMIEASSRLASGA